MSSFQIELLPVSLPYMVRTSLLKHVACMRGRNLRGRDHLEDLGIGGRII
jgi:hypothetical protein